MNTDIRYILILVVALTLEVWSIWRIRLVQSLQEKVMSLIFPVLVLAWAGLRLAVHTRSIADISKADHLATFLGGIAVGVGVGWILFAKKNGKGVL